MKFIELTAAYQKEWNHIATHSNDAWLFHLYEWLPFTESVWGFESKSFLLEHEGKLIGIFPLQMKKSSKGLKSIGMGTGGGALLKGLSEGVRKKALKAMYEHVQTIAIEHQSPTIEVFLSPLSVSSLTNTRSINPLLHYFYEDTSSHTWIVDLTQSEEEIWNNYSDDARRSIKKAKDKGYTITPITQEQGMEKYYEVHCQTAQRTGIDPHPKEYFLGAYKHFCTSGHAIVWEAKDSHGESVAFEITALFNKGALYWMGCCQSAHLDHGINYLLQHHSMLWAKGQGALWFENGEAFPNVQQGKLRGLTLFKGKFGGDLHRFFKGKMELNPKALQDNVFKNWARATIRLLKPILGEKGVQNFEQGLSRRYKQFRKLINIKKFLTQIPFLRPDWQFNEFWIGLSYQDNPNQSNVQEMTASLRQKLNIKGSLLATSSGRTALELALKVIKKTRPQKNKVLISTYGCRGIFDPILNAGLTPIFADIGLDLNLSHDSVKKLMAHHKDIAAIVIPHLCGTAAQIEPLSRLAQQEGIIIIEDACQSLGTLQDKQSLGTQYDMAIFSFGLGKTIMATSGGILSSRILENELAQEYKLLEKEQTRVVKRRFWKMFVKYFLRWNVNCHQEILDGYRYCQMHPLDAALIDSQLKRLEHVIDKQKRYANDIIQSLKETPLHFHIQDNQAHSYTKLSVIFDDENDCRKLLESLNKEGIEIEEMYTPLHLRDFSKGFPTGENLFNSEKIYKNVFNIPVRPNLKRHDLQRIKNAIRRIAPRH
jgi:dTDP-4-amino-4,6-dideoxygalactose transaminase